ncbi:hypothetical protein AEGHOMDF_4818 [Methylobacterium soli]|nr:hypothetical protein AEGHOMDF_4818 [Methylobacterium soli]
MSPSTVTQLKLRPVPALRRACSTPCDRAASVKTKDSIVAMSGAIMPAPLAMPLIRTGTPAISAVRVASFGKVSVVMIAWAAALQASGPPAARAAQSASTPSNLRASRGSPITPVEAMKIALSGQPAAAAAIRAVSATASRPLAPVKALALPELTTRARASGEARASRHQSTGAEGHFERVKTPAACVPSARAT